MLNDGSDVPSLVRTVVWTLPMRLLLARRLLLPLHPFDSYSLEWGIPPIGGFVCFQPSTWAVGLRLSKIVVFHLHDC
jgi:hypothetical protein